MIDAEAQEAAKQAEHQARCERIQKLSIRLVDACDSLAIRDDVMTLEDRGHKFEVREVEG